MIELCLKFDSEAEALSALQAAGYLLNTVAAGEYETPGAHLSIIGPIVRSIGEPDADGVQPTEQLPGWHVNALLAGPAFVMGTRVLQRVAGGVAGCTYSLRAEVDGASSQHFVLPGELVVQQAQ